jgi:hypothetical protein
MLLPQPALLTVEGPQYVKGTVDGKAYLVRDDIYNSTQAEIACIAAQITNGNTFEQEAVVGSLLGGFTLVAVLASFVKAVYSDDVVEMRMHYTHSPSVMVVFAV